MTVGRADEHLRVQVSEPAHLHGAAGYLQPPWVSHGPGFSMIKLTRTRSASSAVTRSTNSAALSRERGHHVPCRTARIDGSRSKSSRAPALPLELFGGVC
jgi:hypothetical protein